MKEHELRQYIHRLRAEADELERRHGVERSFESDADSKWPHAAPEPTVGRFDRVEPTNDQAVAMGTLRVQFQALERLVDHLIPQKSSYALLALDKIEEAAMYLNKAISHPR